MIKKIIFLSASFLSFSQVYADVVSFKKVLDQKAISYENYNPNGKEGFVNSFKQGWSGFMLSESIKCQFPDEIVKTREKSEKKQIFKEECPKNGGTLMQDSWARSQGKKINKVLIGHVIKSDKLHNETFGEIKKIGSDIIKGAAHSVADRIFGKKEDEKLIASNPASTVDHEPEQNIDEKLIASNPASTVDHEPEQNINNISIQNQETNNNEVQENNPIENNENIDLNENYK